MPPDKTPFTSTLFSHLLPTRTILLLVAYTTVFVVSLFLAYELRFDFAVDEQWRALRWENMLWIVPLKLILLFAFGQFGGLLSYFRLPDLYRVFAALVITALFLIYVWYATEGRDCPPRSVILGDFIFSLVLICGFRIGLRVVREGYFTNHFGRTQRQCRVAIVGAGDVGAAIAADTLSRRGLGIRPVVFLDDDKKKWKKHIHGITVVDSPDNLGTIRKKFDINEIIIAMPSAPTRRIREIVKQAQQLGIKADIVPSLAELTTGKVRANRVRPVDIEDLLGREPVKLDSKHIQEMLKDKVVMVTGAGGSIGRELCRQIAFHHPKRLLLVEQSETQLFQIEQDFVEEGYGSLILPLVANILDERRMRYILEKMQPQIIFHAAAHKHVFLMERQPAEAIKNNFWGTQKLADLASEHGVNRFVLISTDKAINPTSVMGASKRLAEIYIQAKQNNPANCTEFMAVRFGNVLGSSGSVIPIFRKQIAAGGPVKVTHPDVTRFFMTVSEAAGLVLQSATQGCGGEIYVLDMGSPIKIVDLARLMIELSGFRPDIDIEIEYIGLRAGEKLFEEIQHVGETLVETPHPRILRFICEPKPMEKMDPFLQKLVLNSNIMERNQLKEMLKKIVPEYTPFFD